MKLFRPGRIAQAAYDAYGKFTGNKNFRGEPMPAWEELGDKIRGAWVAAICAVADELAETDGQDENTRPVSKPSLGRIVHYTLTQPDADAIQARRAREVTTASMTGAGRTYPAVVVGTFTDPGTVNLQVLLDGPDAYWATSRAEGEGPGFWSWPERV